MGTGACGHLSLKLQVLFFVHLSSWGCPCAVAAGDWRVFVFCELEPYTPWPPLHFTLSSRLGSHGWLAPHRGGRGGLG